MATKKRLIDANALADKVWNIAIYIFGVRNGKTLIKEFVEKYRDSVMKEIANAPIVDAVEVDDMREFAEDVVYQFGYYCQNGGRLHITHGGLSTLEQAFDILGWENPHPVPECECEIEGCHEHATCGTLTADGYKRMCGRHSRNHCAKMDGERQ